MAQQFPPTTIIGAGAVGSALGFALDKKGYPIVSVISKTAASAQLLAKRLHCEIASTQLRDIPSSTRLIIVSVPDNTIPDIDKQLGLNPSLHFNQILVIHTSGMQPASVLRTISLKGAATAAVHPIQMFPKHTKGRSNQVQLYGIYYGVECSKNNLPKVKKLVQDLEGNMIMIPVKLRPIYHTACVFSSSYLVILLNSILELAKSLHLEDSWYEVFSPLMNAATINTIDKSAATSLTGPIVRNDLQTLDSHLNALKKFAPELIPFYTMCGLEVARLAQKNGRISKKEYKDIEKLFIKNKQKNEILTLES